MAQLFIPLQGAHAEIAGSGANTYGENLNRPTWSGAEIGLLRSFADVMGAVPEAEFYDWIIGVHHPLFIAGGPAWCRFYDRDPAVRAAALQAAELAAQGAHRQTGARYILFHFPWPGLQGPDGPGPGWPPNTPYENLADWTEAEVYEVGRRVFAHLAAVQARERIEIVLEIDGPHPYFFGGDLYERLFAEFPDLSLCVDTGRLGLLAKTHNQDPLTLGRRLLPWTRHLHLHTSHWDEQGRYHAHLPTTAAHTRELWPRVTPAADLARMVVAAQPACRILLEHDPQAVPAEELEAAHAFANSLIGR